MHLVIVRATVLIITLFILVKYNVLSILYAVILGLIYLGGMSVLVTYVCCVSPDRVFPKGNNIIPFVVFLSDLFFSPTPKVMM